MNVDLPTYDRYSPRADAPLRCRIPLDQKRALDQLADERNVPVSAIVRAALAGVTGVEDTTNVYRRRGTKPSQKGPPGEATS